MNKLPAAPASTVGCAATPGVVAEPDDAGFWAINGGVVLFYLPLLA